MAARPSQNAARSLTGTNQPKPANGTAVVANGPAGDSNGGNIDIRASLEKTFKGDLEFKGSFAFSKSLNNAPNPILRLEGLGTVSVPLSDREAKAVISECIQAPFGKGERTVVDKEVRDTWEMDASKVAFQNPSWATFVTGIVGEVCKALGVNAATSQPRAELYKLLVYEKGSHFLPHVDTEKANGMFATLVIVLPTQFTGGDAHLSHGGVNSVFNTSNSSLTKTSVLCWYTDVIHEIKPITGGYRLALAYNLVHTTTSIKPVLPSTVAATTNIRAILKAWQQKPQTPQKIIYKLEHDYSMANLSASALKSSDAHLFAILNSVAEELGFCLGFVHIAVKLVGAAGGGGGCDYARRKHRYYGYSDDEDDEDDENVGFMEVYEREVTINHLIGPGGEYISNSLQYKEDDEFIPKGFIRALENSDDYDNQEYEGYMGNGAGSLERFYRRTALIIWPPTTMLGKGNWDRRAIYAQEVLDGTKPGKPSVEEAALFDYLCRTASQLTDLSGLDLGSLLRAAARWKDAERWVRGAQCFQGKPGADPLPVEEISQAIKIFGFPKVVESVKSIIEKDRRNFSRLSFLAKFETWATSSKPSKLTKQAVAFAKDMRNTVMAHLGPPEASEMELLTNESTRMGGFAFLKDKVIPQILPLSSVQFLEGYTTFLHNKLSTLDASSEDAAILKTIIASTLETVLAKIDLFSLHTAEAPKSYYAARPTPEPRTAKGFLTLCVDCSNIDVAVKAVDKVTDMTGLSEDVARSRVAELLIPLLDFLSKDIRARCPSLPLRKLGELVVQHHLQGLGSGGSSPSRAVISNTLDSAILVGDAGLLTATVIPKFKSVKWESEYWKNVIEEIDSRRDRELFKTIALAPILKEMATIYARQINVAASGGYHYGYYSHTSKDALGFLLKTGGTEPMATLLDRILDQKLLSADYVTRTLLPLITELRTLAAKHNLPLAVDPFAQAIRKIVNAWVDKILGPTPDFAKAQALIARLQQWSCTCDACAQARKGLTASSEPRVELQRIGAPKRKHVEGMLVMYGTGAATFSTIGRSPQGLLIIKDNALHRPQVWKAIEKQGVALVKSIGDEGILKAIWGNYYNALLESLRTGKKIAAIDAGVPITPVPMPPSAVAPQVPKPLPRPQAGATQPPVSVIPAKRKAVPEAIIDLRTP